MLISQQYAELNRELHERDKQWGTNGHKAARHLEALAEKFGGTTVLDYGSGKGMLQSHLIQNAPYFIVRNYEPAFEIDEREPCDLVVCRDVLEHIEPEYLDDVLDDIRCLTIRAAYLCIGIRPSGDFLSDGRNTHCIVKPVGWWEVIVRKYFDPYSTVASNKTIEFYVTPKTC